MNTVNIMNGAKRVVNAIKTSKSIDLLIDFKEVKRSIEDLADEIAYLGIDQESKFDALEDLDLAAEAMNEFFRSCIENPQQADCARRRAVRRLRRAFDTIKRASDDDYMACVEAELV